MITIIFLCRILSMFILTLAIDLWSLICVREANGK